MYILSDDPAHHVRKHAGSDRYCEQQVLTETLQLLPGLPGHSGPRGR